MFSAWLLLGAAITAEITAALALRLCDGFTKPLPAVLALAAFGIAFYVVSLPLQTHSP
jgi:small multidrug resistance pump